MKKIFILLILIFSFFVFDNHRLIRAQDLDPSNTLNTIIDPNCGGINQVCCSIDQVNVPAFGFKDLTSPWDTIMKPVNILLNSFSNTYSVLATSIVKFTGAIFDFNYKEGYCREGTVPSDKHNPGSCTCFDNRIENISRLCLMVDAKEQSSCLSCVTDKKGIWTAVGCLESDISSLIKNTIFGWGVGLAGGFALLCIIYAAFQMQSSQGNPEKLKKAQEMLTSCIMGLILIIFSVFILRLIGVSILRIPGFG